MSNWYMLTVVGKDRPGIVSRITLDLFKGGANLGEASMARLGGNFSIMLMVHYESSSDLLEKLISPVCNELDLSVHIDPIQGELHEQIDPDIRISIYGADRAGIVAETTGVLVEKGLNIINLESGVGGSSENPIYIMEVDGVTSNGVEPIRLVLDKLAKEKNIKCSVTPIKTLMG